MFKKQKVLGVGLVLLLVLMLAPIAAAQMTPGVMVSDQNLDNGTVTIDSVSSDGPGWIVIHADDGGSPGPVLGQTAVNDGENQNVSVEIDPEGVTPILYAMLHTDAGEEGVYEFPGDDTPVSADGQVVMQSFNVIGGLMESDTMAETEIMVETDTMTDTAATAESPEVLPATGGAGTPWLVIGLVLIGALLAVSGFTLARRSA